MPTPVAAARQCLSPTAASALDSAVASARRRAHAQTTSLHLIASLLAPTSPALLRDTLARARSAAYSPRVQLKALELCFAVSLDRLPSASGGGGGDEPPVSNSLMAAIKRSQANQRRNPDTFQLYHQAVAAQPPAAVKVELSQLVLAILDDPVVSRVFGEAGFRSGDIKLAILRPAPPTPLLGRLPARRRPPPLFLCSFAAADDAEVPSPAGSLAGAGAGEENCRRIAELLARGRNPMLVGVGAASAAADFTANCPYRILSVDSTSMEQIELAAAAAISTAASGLIISIGDLKELVSDEADHHDRGSRVVAEVTRVLETHKGGRVWVMGWSATYETYLKFLSKFPLLDKDWELQLLPITSVRAGGGSPSSVTPPTTAATAFLQPPSLMDSFVPFGGSFSGTYESNNCMTNPYLPAIRCQYCNDKYEQEVAAIIQGSGITAEDHDHGCPSWLQKGSMAEASNGFDAVKVRDDQMVLNSKIVNLQKKWNDYCLRVHQSCPRIDRDNFRLFPQYVGVLASKERAANQNKSIEAVGLQREATAPSTITVFHNSIPSPSISLPSTSQKWNEDSMPKFQVRHSKSDEHLQGKGVQPRHGNLSEFHDHEDYASPSSAASVATDLVLGTPRDSSSKEQSPVWRRHAEDAQKSINLQPKNADNLKLKHPQLSIQSYSCTQNSANAVQLMPRTLHSAVSEGMPAFGQWHRPSPCALQSSDLSNYKLFVECLFKKVERQEEALSAISRAIVQCRSGERCRGASRKNDTWLSFHGPDSMAKRRVAVALAEIVYGNKENLIYLDLSLQDGDGPNFRGKTSADCIIGELSKKPRSVIFLDNVDRADCLAQDSLSHAIRTGRFLDFRGREIDINDSIVVLSTRTIQGGKSVSLREEEGCTFSEERILTARGFQLKILVELSIPVFYGGLGNKVAVSPRRIPRSTQATLLSVSVSKRKLNTSNDQEKLQESPGVSKKLHRTSSLLFDLNLPVDEAEPQEADSSSGSHENNSSSDNAEGSLDNLFSSVDEAISFKPFDFDKLADDILKEISNVLSNILGPECRLEIDIGAMEQILAAAWASEDRRPLQSWLDQVLARSFAELKLRCNHVHSSTLRLVTSEDDIPAKDHGSGALLPSRIILD